MTNCDMMIVMDYAPPGHGGPQPGAGRPRLPEITEDQIAHALSIDCSEIEAAALLGVSVPTLRRRISELAEAEGTDYERWRAAKQALGRARIRSQLHELAAAGPVAHTRAALPALTANIWLSKNRLGYRDQAQAREQPITIQIIAPDGETKVLVQQILGQLPAPKEGRDAIK